MTTSTYAKMAREERGVLSPEPGIIVGEKYRILRALGEGGMGTVYEAENTLTLKRAAIKWLHPRLVAVEEASKRLLHEARATARIRHRNVVDVYDVLAEGTSVFLVIELLIGEQLSELLAREELWLHELIRLLLPAMAGVAAAHAVGVVHRDIKPDNIFLAQETGTREPVPKVIDFGISRVFEADGARLTHSGMTMGTPKYVSYEQLRGARDVDERTDIYAFGVILYEAIVGSPPYQADTFGEQAISFVTTEPAPPAASRPELPDLLNELVLAAIRRDREQRVSTLNELIERLEPFTDPGHYLVPLRVRLPRAYGASAGDASLRRRTTAPQNHTPMPEGTGRRSSGQAARSLPTPKRRSSRGVLLVATLALGLCAAGMASWWTRRSPHTATRGARGPAAGVDVRGQGAPSSAPLASPLAIPEDAATEPSAATVQVAAEGGADMPARAAGRLAPSHATRAAHGLRPGAERRPELLDAARLPAEPSIVPEQEHAGHARDAALPGSVADVPHRSGGLKRDQF